MKLHPCIISFSILILSMNIAFSQQDDATINEIFKDKGEVYFRFENAGLESIHHLTKMISIDHKTESQWIYAYANKKEFDRFLELKIDYELLPHPGSLIHPAMKDKVDIKGINEWDYYPTYEAYVDMMYQFETNYPEHCDVFSIGTTVEGRQLLIAKLSVNVNVQENEPRFLYTSSIHGDEATGYILMLRLIDYLLKNFETDDQVTHLLKNMEIWINPLANPDGTYAGGNESVSGATRYNANTVDLNRNYPDPEDGPHPDGNAWQPETIEFMELADSVSFVMAANFHGGVEVFNYPWDTWAQLHADDDWWRLIGREWADTIHAHAPVGYFTFMNNGITNGYEWYEINGGRQDYMNYFHHCREVTVEISNVKMLPEYLLPSFWEYNYRSFLNYMAQGLYGISGTLTDAQTGLPVKGTIVITDHDIENSFVLSDSITGKYFRPLMEGTYSVTYSAPKYASQTVENVSVFNYQLTTRNVELVFTGAGIEEEAFTKWFNLGLNPAGNMITINYSGDENLVSNIEIADITGKIVFRRQFNFSNDKSFLHISAGGLGSGVYLVKIASDKFEMVKKMIIR